MKTSESKTWHAARRAYEMGRMRSGLTRGFVVASLVAGLALACCGPRAFAWVPLTWLAWGVVEWRGGTLRAGGLRGLVAGAATLLLPATWLRVCCEGMERGAACRAPEACGILGGLIGVAVAIALPRTASASKGVEAAFGAVIGVLAVSAVRCTLLLRGEALGLAFGLAAGLAAMSATRTWAEQRRASGDVRG
jgi:hypothetical protein